jgi:hypothetical protein
MAWSSKINAELGIVESTFRGPTTAADIRENTTAALALARQAGTTRHLIDSSELTFAASLTDLYQLPASQYEREQVDRRSRIAILSPRDEKAREATHFYQTACVNRGWSVKLFADRQEAIGWLRGEAGR